MRNMMWWAAMLATVPAIGLTATAVAEARAPSAPEIVQKDTQRDAALTKGADQRIVRFSAQLQGNVPPRKEGGPYMPRGTVTVAGKSDPIFGAGEGRYETVILSNADGKGGFVTRDAKIIFPTGTLQFEGIFPTHNDPTPIDGVRQTAMVEKVLGGTGRFAGASGYLMLISSLEENGDIRATFTGMLFVRK